MGLQKVTTLEDMLRYGPMEPRHSLRLWMGIVKVLEEKHSEGKFFGTLNPTAVLIDMKNNIVLVDSTPDRSSPYAAPEVLAGEAPDEMADIYSLGVMLYRMLAGSLEGLHRLPPSRVSEEVPRWIDPIVLRCIMKQRSRRYLDLEELSESLAQVMRNLQSIKGGG